MRRLAVVIAAMFVASSAAAAEKTTRIPDAALSTAATLREQALADDTGWKVVESLTTEVGPRMAGSDADARAVAWATAKFQALGFDKVWTEPVTFPKWERRSEHAQVLGANAQPLRVTALGRSPAGTVEAEVVRFADLAALQAAPAGSLRGKIAFVDYQMVKARDGKDYGNGGAVRSKGPSEAIRKGAIGFVMRSAGTDSHRVPHTGITRFDEGLTPIPAAALAVPDANQLARLVARGPLRLRLALDCGWDGQATSYNVIGEITGRSKPKDVVVIGGHLDAWDLGTGAIDDGAGVGISMAAGHLIGQLKRAPKRTIRVVAFANEEQGLYGGKAYAQAHAKDVALHQIAAESDFGAGRIYAFNTGSGDAAASREATRQIAKALAPLGIDYAPGSGGPGPDVGPLAAKGGAWAWLAQDGSDYFDLHHSADDTLDKIDPKALEQNVAAYAVFAYLAAEADGGFRSQAKTVQPPRE
ncbi:M28 family peptidase [Xanthomonas translucens pv. translucens]|uniref:M28 family peptidase n=1 Tax=Xanthomonas campestris pv. translucens TaxID=343 RepID=UPI001F62029C|nr:M28 family peptidase [Xanthomonas translucens]MCT8284967.1 M28 family peptidase [Xanthomonas translucens pv. translucens]MCT8302625.1 M28 family peptidase [Xanthomonas translucens pv. translucens]UNT97721.1 M28 family peptidase [Xanthomonas translucens pv. translucens]